MAFFSFKGRQRAKQSQSKMSDRYRLSLGLKKVKSADKIGNKRHFASEETCSAQRLQLQYTKPVQV